MRAIRRTSSRLPRAVSCASITPSREGSATSRATRPSCSTTPVSVCPTPSWSSCATRSRSPSCAASARRDAVAPLGLEPLEHLVEGRGQLGRLGVPAADLEPVAGLERVDPARELRQLAQRGERVPQQQQVEREHQHEAAAEDRQLAQRDVLDARGEHERRDRARRGEHGGIADGESPEERRTARASEHRRSLAVAQRVGSACRPLDSGATGTPTEACSRGSGREHAASETVGDAGGPYVHVARRRIAARRRAVTMGGTPYMSVGGVPRPLDAPLSTDAAPWTGTATVEGGEGAAPAGEI